MSSVDRRLQRALDAVVRSSALGAALAVEVGGQRQATVAAGFQDIGMGQGFQPDMLYQIGSQTKMLVSTGILLLVKDGKLTLDDDVNAILPEVAGLTGGQRIAITQLLNHTSGLGNYTDMMVSRGWLMGGWPVPDYTDDDLLMLAATMGFAFMPGERVAYSNTNYILLGRIIERLSGEPSTAFLKRRVLDPLGMTDTHFARSGTWPRDRTVTGGIIRPASPSGDLPQRDDPPKMGWASSAGDGISTLDQMLKFSNALMGRNNPLGIKLDDFMARLMPLTEPWVFRDFIKGFGYGMANFDIGGRSWLGHTGGTATHLTATICCPELDAAISLAMTFVADARAPAKADPMRDHVRLTLCLAAYEAERIATSQ
jgi:D-alanyl-D-alanine carboxypeptidase